MHRRLPGICLILVTILVAACKEEGTVKVRSLNFVGAKRIDTSKLADVLATKKSSRLPWGRKAYFDRKRFDMDLQRLQAYCADRGFPDARVTSFDVKLNDKQDAVDLTITIAEGDPVTVASISFVGFEQIPPDHLGTLKGRIPLKVDAPRDRALVVSTREMALDELKDHGYPYAVVETREDATATPKRVSLVFTATPGTLAYIGPVQIQGNKTVSDHTIERQLTFKTDDLYQRTKLQDSQRRLYGMELFQFANIEPLNQEQPVKIPVRITVAEGSHQRVNFGVGYGAEEKARVDAEYHHVNFFGGARTAGAHVRWSSLDRGVRLDFNQPYFFAPHFSLGAEGQQWYTFTPAYNTTVSGAKVIVTHRNNQQMSWSASFLSEHQSSSIAPDVLADLTLRNNLIALGLDPTTGEQTGQLNAVGFDFQRSTADNVLDARRGYQLAFHGEQAGGVLAGSFNYDSLSVDGRHYLPISDSLVFASRLQMGLIHPHGSDAGNVPFTKKFFLGGATSVRGWGRYEISPLSDSGLPIGGNSMVALSGELRAVLSGNIGGVVFVDGGNAWTDASGISLGDLRYAAGVGLRYRTPVGPVRLDFGYQLNPIPGLLVNGEPEQRHWRIHFSIGQAF